MFDHFFDIETTPIGTPHMKFVCGCAMDEAGEGFVYETAEESDLVDDLLSRQGRIWSHNGGRFDLLWLSDHLIRRKLPARYTASGSRIVRLQVGEAVFCDTAALFKMSLKELTSECGVSKDELGLPCRGLTTCESNCKGYCQCYPGTPHLKRILEYCVRDVQSLAKACQVMEEFAQKNGIELGITVGSTAWKTAMRWLDLPKGEMSFAEHKRLRSGLYGGRCQVFRPKAATGNIYDVRSMYPWALSSSELPWGSRPNWVTGATATAAFSKSQAGFYRATCIVPNMWIPPLPARSDSGRNAYPVGAWSAWWALPELQYAASIGVDIKVAEAAVWPESKNVFRPWAEALFKLRDDVGKSTPFGQWVKFLLNSLTGKLAAKTIHEDIEAIIDDTKIQCCLASQRCHRCGSGCGPDCERAAPDCGKCCNHHCSGWCGAHRWLSNRLFSRQVKFVDSCAHPEWAGYLYAISRVRLHTVLTEGDGDACYTDTDSCFALGIRSGVGKNLGDLDCEPFCEFEARAPKLYGVRKLVSGRWEQVVRAKGFTEKNLAVLKGEPSRRVNLRGFRAGARKGEFFCCDELEKSAELGYGDRILDGEVTRPPTVEEANLK